MTPTPEPPRDPVAALREPVEAAERFSAEASYSVPVSTEEDFVAALEDARATLEALESGERVTLWRCPDHGVLEPRKWDSDWPEDVGYPVQLAERGITHPCPATVQEEACAEQMTPVHTEAGAEVARVLRTIDNLSRVADAGHPPARTIFQAHLTECGRLARETFARLPDTLEVIEAVKTGEFDATKEESERWAASKDGQDAFRALVEGR